MDYTPVLPTPAELKEMAALQDLQDMWGAEDSEDMLLNLQNCYIAKFDFTNESPGYVGDLFLIQPGSLQSESPVVRLYRNRQKRLVILE